MLLESAWCVVFGVEAAHANLAFCWRTESSVLDDGALLAILLFTLRCISIVLSDDLLHPWIDCAHGGINRNLLELRRASTAISLLISSSNITMSIMNGILLLLVNLFLNIIELGISIYTLHIVNS